MLEGFLQLTSASLHLLEQSCVLDGNHCLVGERFDQGYLARAERFNEVAIEIYDADHLPAQQEWHSESGPSGIVAEMSKVRQLRIDLYVCDLECPTLQGDTTRHRRAARLQHDLSEHLCVH